jgi:hypothetical protein
MYFTYKNTRGMLFVKLTMTYIRRFRMSSTIPGYTYGTAAVGPSPLTMEDVEQLKQTVLFGPSDEAALRLAGAVLADQVDTILDEWYGFVAAHPHLVAYFSDFQGKPNETYLDRVRQRFAQWIMDTCTRPYDQAWLDYQYEIGLRHYTAKKNQTDQVDSVPVIHLRYLIAFIYPITATIKPYLAKKGHSAEQVERMYHAWFKSVTLQVALWSAPYVSSSVY